MREDLLRHYKCATCGGPTQKGTTTHSVDLDHGVFVIRNVPAAICTHCGDEWLDNDTAKTVERLVLDAKRRGSQIEVIVFAESSEAIAATT